LYHVLLFQLLILSLKVIFSITFGHQFFVISQLTYACFGEIIPALWTVWIFIFTVKCVEASLAANMLGEAQHHRMPHVDIEGLQADGTVRIHLLHNSIRNELHIYKFTYL
jgi:hypothetical protein